MLKIIRKICEADTVEEFEFDVKGFNFLVKNLSDGDILVCFNEFDENANIKIPAGTSQIITQNIDNFDSNYLSNTICVKSSGEGEVEIQCLKY